MKKLLYIFFIVITSQSIISCSDSDDSTYFNIKESSNSGDTSIYLEIERFDTEITFNIETNLKNWSIEKGDSRENFWSFDKDSKFDEYVKDKTTMIEGNGNKTIKVYFIKNENQADRNAHITVKYDGKKTKTIQIKQKGNGKPNKTTIGKANSVENLKMSIRGGSTQEWNLVDRMVYVDINKGFAYLKIMYSGKYEPMLSLIYSIVDNPTYIDNFYDNIAKPKSVRYGDIIARGDNINGSNLIINQIDNKTLELIFKDYIFTHETNTDTKYSLNGKMLLNFDFDIK